MCLTDQIYNLDDLMRNVSSTSIFVENTMFIYLAKLSILRHFVLESRSIIGVNIVNIFHDNIDLFDEVFR
jgi:hypothetical protein